MVSVIQQVYEIIILRKKISLLFSLLSSNHFRVPRKPSYNNILTGYLTCIRVKFNRPFHWYTTSEINIHLALDLCQSNNTRTLYGILGLRNAATISRWKLLSYSGRHFETHSATNHLTKTITIWLTGAINNFNFLDWCV